MDAQTTAQRRKNADLLILLCFTAYTAVYVARKNYSVCMTGMIADGVLDKVTGGTAGSVFLALYAGGQLVNGILGDRVSPRVMITLGLCGAGGCNLLMGVQQTGALIPVIWGLNGIFCSMLWSAVIRCFSEWLPDDAHDRAGIWIGATIPIGAVCSYLLCAAMIRFFDWRAAFFACGGVAIAAGLLFCFRVERLHRALAPAGKEDGSGAEESIHPRSQTPLLRLIVSTGLVFTVFGILANGVLKDGLDLWVPTLLCEFFGLDSSAASLLTAVLPVINLSGTVAAQQLNSRVIHCEMTVAGIMFGISVVSFIPLLILTGSGCTGLWAAILSVILISITSASMLGANSMFLTFIPFHFSTVGRSSGVTGFLNCCSYAAAALSGVTFGMISESSGWTVTLLAFGACALLGAVISFVGAHFWRRGMKNIR